MTAARFAGDSQSLLASVVFEATWEMLVDSGALEWDERLGLIFGYEPGELVNDRSWWRERVHPADLEQVELELIHFRRQFDYAHHAACLDHAALSNSAG